MVQMNTLMFAIACVLFVIPQTNAILNLFGAELAPTCRAEVYNISIPDECLDSLKLLIIKGDTFRSYNLTDSPLILLDPFFNPFKQTIIYCHGFLNGPLSTSSVKVAKAYLKDGKYNVLMLDASELLCSDYISAVTAIRSIGMRLGQELFDLSRIGFKINSLTVVGFSLGAHIAGFAGKRYNEITKRKKLPRIIGVEPAGPCYHRVPPNRRLAKTDADFVQVIHTNGGVFGMQNAIGHVDFYVNGGRLQPLLFITPFNLILCSHGRGIELWESVILNPRMFYGKKCSDTKEIDCGLCIFKNSERLLMGHLCDPSKEGVYLILTTAIYPYYFI